MEDQRHSKYVAEWTMIEVFMCLCVYVFMLTELD
jgi:hypothetical protein